MYAAIVTKLFKATSEVQKGAPVGNHNAAGPHAHAGGGKSSSGHDLPKDTGAFLHSLTAPKLKTMINSAVTTHGIHESWKAPKTNDKDELVGHISEMSNNHGITPALNGQMVKHNPLQKAEGGFASVLKGK